jgi:transposase-like protein
LAEQKNFRLHWFFAMPSNDAILVALHYGSVYNETDARHHIEALRWPHGPVCPFCRKSGRVKTKSVRMLGGKSMGEGWYYCRLCRKKFTVRMGTLFEGSKIPFHKWLDAISLCVYDETCDASKLSKHLDITYRSARFLMDRLEKYQQPGAPPILGD